jgi:hypothetical protein
LPRASAGRTPFRFLRERREGSTREQRLIEEILLVGCRGLKDLSPPGKVLAFDGWALPVALSQAVKKNLLRSIEVVKFDRRAKGACPEAERVPLRPGPGAPFDDDGIASRKKILREFPLQSLDLVPHVGAMEIEAESLQPIIGTEANGMEPMFKLQG